MVAWWLWWLWWYNGYDVYSGMVVMVIKWYGGYGDKVVWWYGGYVGRVVNESNLAINIVLEYAPSKKYLEIYNKNTRQKMICCWEEMTLFSSAFNSPGHFKFCRHKGKG